MFSPKLFQLQKLKSRFLHDKLIFFGLDFFPGKVWSCTLGFGGLESHLQHSWGPGWSRDDAEQKKFIFSSKWHILTLNFADPLYSSPAAQ